MNAGEQPGHSCSLCPAPRIEIDQIRIRNPVAAFIDVIDGTMPEQVQAAPVGAIDRDTAFSSIIGLCHGCLSSSLVPDLQRSAVALRPQSAGGSLSAVKRVARVRRRGPQHVE